MVHCPTSFSVLGLISPFTHKAKQSKCTEQTCTPLSAHSSCSTTAQPMTVQCISEHGLPLHVKIEYSEPRGRSTIPSWKERPEFEMTGGRNQVT